MKPDSTPVAVIVPVFRNLAATQRCIESILASEAGPRTRLIIIDDDSPEPEVSAWCEQLRARKGVTVMRNPQNLGFVATVNRGIEAGGNADIVLLNSDTEVANDWLQRLQDCAYSSPNVGTVTPLSNNASVCSYPIPLAENALPAGWSMQAIDVLAARVNRGQRSELPTAVGFCMYIRRSCLEEIGTFDEENFGVGYGEECDFSMRAKSAGWINVLSPDVFVYHEGGQSFTTQTEERIRAAEETLQRLHPHYHVQATQFIDEDPIRPFRDALDLGRLQKSPGDASSIITALQAHRDARIDTKTNREMALEHALEEVKLERESLANKLTEVLATLDSTEQELAARTEKLASTAHELFLLRQRDQRWRYLLALINRMDALRLRFTDGGMGA